MRYFIFLIFILFLSCGSNPPEQPTPPTTGFIKFYVDSSCEFVEWEMFPVSVYLDGSLWGEISHSGAPYAINKEVKAGEHTISAICYVSETCTYLKNNPMTVTVELQETTTCCMMCERNP